MSATDPTLPPLPRFRDVVAGSCANHPGRDIVALCRACQKSCCGECATRRDGVNYCAECIVARNAQLAITPGARHIRAAQQAATTGGALLGTPARVLATGAFYFIAAALAAAWGIGMPFLANERRLEANKDRMTQVQIALSAYYDDIGHYPPKDRGLAALLVANDEDRADWRGPYTTALASGGKGVIGADPAVADVFGQPILFYSQTNEDDTIEVLYLASRGANGSWDTPGIETGNPPHEPTGDDVIKWVVWP
jgi:hypothetical protein